MSTSPAMNDIIDGITLTSIARANISPALLDHVSTLLTQQEEEDLSRGWLIISTNSETDRTNAILQAFGYHEPDPAFEFQFKAFVQKLLSVIWRQDQETASVLARTLSSDNLIATDTQPRIHTRLDMVLLNDAMINARILPRRNPDIPQTYVDKFGLPTDSCGGKEGRDYFYHDTDEATCKLECLKRLFDGDIVRWNERDWSEGLYGDPNDLSISGTNTGWVVQRETRIDQQASGSRGRLPGSYRNSDQTEDNIEAREDLYNIEDRGTNVRYDKPMGSEVIQSLLHPVHQPIPTQDQSSFTDNAILYDGHALTDQPRLHIADAQKTDVSKATHPLHSRSEHSQVAGVIASHNSGELTKHDRHLLESYRRDFVVREEELRTLRRQRREEKKLIRTKSEEEIARRHE